VNLPVLGSAVGHNVKVGSGFIVYPGRMIESNAVIIFDNEKSLIRRTVPGHDLDDLDHASGEPQRIIYHWPNVYHDPAAGVAPPPPDEPPAQSNGTHHHPTNGAASTSWDETPEIADEAYRHDHPTAGVARARRTDR
jgi:hypothetical protein